MILFSAKRLPHFSLFMLLFWCVRYVVLGVVLHNLLNTLWGVLLPTATKKKITIERKRKLFQFERIGENEANSRPAFGVFDRLLWREFLSGRHGVCAI